MVHLNLNNPESVFYGNYRRQLAATLTVNLIAFSHGIGLGWVAPMLLIFQSPESPLAFNVSVQEISWIGAYVGVGAVTGSLIFGVLLDLIGRKKCLYIVAVPHIFFWILVFIANDVNYLYIARILGGTTGGGLYAILPIFVAEIADSKIRGTLCSIFIFTLNIGMLVGNIIASHVPYLIIPCAVIVLPVLFLIIIVQFPETPQFLLRQNLNNAAEKSLKYYTNINANNKDELQQFEVNFNEMKELILSSKNKESFSLMDFCTKRSMKSLLMGLILIVIYNFTGIYAILNYSSLIFAEAHASMDPKTNTIIIGVFQIFGSYCAFVLIDKFGRKFLMLVSLIGMCLGFTLIGVHSYMVTNLAFDSAKWLPVVLMSFIILAANIGVMSVTFIILVEILPPKIRSLATTLCLVFGSLMSGVVLKAFPVLMVIAGLSGAMWILACFSAFGFIFYLVFVGETKGKNLNDQEGYHSYFLCFQNLNKKIKKQLTKKKMVHLNLKNPESVFYGNYRRQLLATLTVNLLAFSHGIGLGWAAPMLFNFQSIDSPLAFNISVQETSWIGANISVGAVIGNVSFGILLDIIGRKKCLYLLAVPHIFFWILIFFASDVNYLYIARILGGTTGGGIYVVLPIFVAEIADLKVRGTLCSVFSFTLNVGMLIGNIVASHVPYLIIPCVIIVLPVLFLIIILQFPETPQFLLRQNLNNAAEKSLKYYTNINDNNKDELQQFEINFNEMKQLTSSSGNKEKLSLKDICTKRSIKSLLIGLVFGIVFSFTGIYVILNYSALIFAEAHSSMDPKTNTIIIGAFQIVGSYCAFVLIDKFGRKILMLVSLIGMCLGFTLIGVHSYMVTNFAFDSARWLPIVLTSFIILAANIGVMSITFIILVEILPPKIRSFGTASCLMFTSLTSFIALKVFPVLMVFVGLSGVMWIFACFSAFGFLFFLIFVGETKGRNLNDEETYN
ncbi:uncharacterized protein LOC129913473 [Episyrphus balteatus]|uniref:uncharacterized protein LOC129913473 n=1 Tax=Episyrphus balteatus TaxID=286459 RepID=UPI002486C9F6|nr:uncharacterized protein LOC129913473 [Episyrphus balteatus]